MTHKDSADCPAKGAELTGAFKTVLEQGSIDPMQIRLALAAAAKAQGMTYCALARKTGLGRHTVKFALDGKSMVAFSIIMQIAAALGLRPKISLAEQGTDGTEAAEAKTAKAE